MLLKSARGDRILADEMFSDVALVRLPRLFELYDEDKGPEDNYMLRNIRWYAFKHVNRIRQGRPEMLEHVSLSDKADFVDALDVLDELHRYLIEANVLYGMTYGEIAQELKWPTHIVSKAVKGAKERLAECYDENRDWVLVKRVIRILCDAQ